MGDQPFTVPHVNKFTEFKINLHVYKLRKHTISFPDEKIYVITCTKLFRKNEIDLCVSFSLLCSDSSIIWELCRQWVMSLILSIAAINHAVTFTWTMIHVFRKFKQSQLRSWGEVRSQQQRNFTKAAPAIVPDRPFRAGAQEIL